MHHSTEGFPSDNLKNLSYHNKRKNTRNKSRSKGNTCNRYEARENMQPALNAKRGKKTHSAPNIKRRKTYSQRQIPSVRTYALNAKYEAWENMQPGPNTKGKNKCTQRQIKRAGKHELSTKCQAREHIQPAPNTKREKIMHSAPNTNTTTYFAFLTYTILLIVS